MAPSWKLIIAGWGAYLVAAPVTVLTGNLWLVSMYAAPLSLWAAGLIEAVRHD